MTLRVDRAADLSAFVGVELPASAALTLTQAEVDGFIALSGDRQWIHADTKRAGTLLPAGVTIVPGNLLLAQLPRLLQQVYAVATFGKCLLAGYREVRFRHPVGSGSSLQLRADLLSVTPARQFVRVETRCRLDLVEHGKAALTAIVTDLYYDESGDL